jgi:hypothetical protein
MSGKPKIAVWRDALRDSELDLAAKVVGHTVATFFDRSLTGFPSKETIAAGASLSKRATDHAILRLEAAGFLAVVRSKGRTSNLYRATLPTVHPGAGLIGVNHASDDTNHASDDSQPCTPVHPNAQNAQNAARLRAASPNGSGASAQDKYSRSPCCDSHVYDHDGRWLCLSCDEPVELEAV